MTDPLHPEAEETYLASLLFPVTARILLAEALTLVAPDDFWNPHVASLWTAARKLHLADRPVTKRAILAAVGNAAVDRIVEQLPPAPPPAAEFPNAVAAVRRCGQMRRLVEATDRIRQRAQIAEDFPQALGWAMEEITKLDVREDATDSEVRSIQALLTEFVTEQKSPAPRRLFRTPWAELNDELIGLFGGRMYVIGARPGDGKSIAAHQIGEHAAAQGHPAIVFSAEMGADEVTGRVVSAGAQVEIRDINRRELDHDSWRRVNEYVDRAQDYPLFIVDKSDLSIPYIRSVCRNQKRRTGLDVIVIDYLQLLTADRSQSREQQVAQISRQLKILARELDASVVVPAQLNRETVRRGKPSIADLRESGGIEADADVVMLLSRQRFPDGHELAGQYNGMLTIDVAKNRHGKQGSIELPWRAHYSTIGNPERSQRFEPERHLSVVDQVEGSA